MVLDGSKLIPKYGEFDLVDDFQEDLGFESKFRIFPIPVLVVIFDGKDDRLFFRVLHGGADHFNAPAHGFFTLQTGAVLPG